MPIRSLTIDNLPCELMLNIFEYLSVEDRKASALTSISWFETINHLNYLLNDNALVFDENSVISENSDVVKSLLLRYKKIRAAKLTNQVQFVPGCDVFWQSLGQTLTEIEFFHCEFLTTEGLAEILRHLTKLKVLKLYAPLFRRWKLFTKSKFLVNDANREALKETLEGITHLTLCDSRINDAHFSNLLQNLPNLVSFDATSLYFRHDTQLPSQLSSHALLTWLAEASNLKDLRLKNVDDDLLDGISSCHELNLKSCSLHLDQIRVETLDSFIQRFPEIEQLNCDLSSCPRPESLLLYLQNVTCLNELKLGIGSTTSNFTTFSKFRNLKKLSMHLAPTSLPSDGNEFTIKSGQNPKLKELEIISDIPFAPGSLKTFTRMINNYKNVTSLAISGIVLSDKELQNIFRVMESLLELTITNCEKISDKGITGQISGGKTKKYSLQNLKGLRRLSLSNCHQLTDKSLKEGFVLPELRYLALNGTTKVTEDGVKALAMNTPVLEEIIWTNRQFLEKSWMETFKQMFRRLKKISINASFQGSSIMDAIDFQPNGNFCFPFDR
ncbi:uncharacterized protein LOC134827268 [Culicoides brevitarsis]|uniref:uncharacterized protein LOC134827268 n=1 Tax=Culicoides brevitarsis TaxID=469753 RepID=UPI00307CA678